MQTIPDDEGFHAVSMLPTITAAPTWQDQAACADADADLFFAADEGQQREAMALCSSCPVREACLEHALATGEQYGIWGGVREQDRRRISRARRQAA